MICVGDIVSLRLASRGSAALSWFFDVAERTFGYVSKSKLNFGLWIRNPSFGHLLSISASAQWAFDPRRRADAAWSEV